MALTIEKVQTIIKSSTYQAIRRYFKLEATPAVIHTTKHFVLTEKVIKDFAIRYFKESLINQRFKELEYVGVDFKTLSDKYESSPATVKKYYDAYAVFIDHNNMFYQEPEHPIELAEEEGIYPTSDGKLRRLPTVNPIYKTVPYVLLQRMFFGSDLDTQRKYQLTTYGNYSEYRFYQATRFKDLQLYTIDGMKILVDEVIEKVYYDDVEQFLHEAYRTLFKLDSKAYNGMAKIPVSRRVLADLYMENESYRHKMHNTVFNIMTPSTYIKRLKDRAEETTLDSWEYIAIVREVFNGNEKAFHLTKAFQRHAPELVGCDCYKKLGEYITSWQVPELFEAPTAGTKKEVKDEEEPQVPNLTDVVPTKEEMKASLLNMINESYQPSPQATAPHPSDDIDTCLNTIQQYLATTTDLENLKVIKKKLNALAEIANGKYDFLS